MKINPQSTILVFDIGLSNCKVVLFREDGFVVDKEINVYLTYRPSVERAEQKPEDWWTATCEAMKRLWERNPSLSSTVVGIVVTGHMHALVYVDKQGKALGPALILSDRRSRNEAIEITTDLGEKNIYEITGALLDPSTPAAKIRWLRSNSPEISKNVYKFLSCKDYIRNKLTGDFYTEPIDACATSLYDIRYKTWSQDMTKAAGVDNDQLPEIRNPESMAGRLLPEPASILNLQVGLPVIMGAGDDIEILGYQLLSPGDSLEHIGTTGSIFTVSNHPSYDPAMALELYPHAIPDLWVIGGSMTMAGGAISWVRDILQIENGSLFSDYKVEKDWIKKLPIFIPHLSGNRCPSKEPFSKGSWVGLTPEINGVQLYQSALIGVAFGLKSILNKVESVMGPLKQIVVNDGSDFGCEWVQIRADIYNHPIAILQNNEPTALGAMTLASTCLGFHPNIRSAVNAVRKKIITFHAQENRAKEFLEQFENYEHISEALKPFWTNLNYS